MSDIGSIILPVDLVLEIDSSSEPNGWLGGSCLKSEHVFVITSAVIGSENKPSEYGNRLSSHRAFQTGMGELSDKLLQWVRIGRDHATKFRPWSAVARSDIETTLGIQLQDGLTFVCTLRSTDKAPVIRALCLISHAAMTVLLPAHLSLLFPPAPYARLPEDTTEMLGQKRVAVIGIGSGGSEIALNLACAGVGELTLFDDDRLEPVNYVRHVLDRRDLARLKVEAIRTALEEREMPTRVLTQSIDVAVSANEFRKTLHDHRPDLLICATDSRASRRFVNQSAVRFDIPLVVAGILDSGRIGEVLLVTPGRTACYECVRLELGAALEPPSSDERPTSPYSGGEEGDLQSAVHRFDIGFVASLATRVSLQVLDGRTYEALPTNYVVWGREKTENNPPFKFDVPLSINYVPVSRRADCPVCGTLPSELSGINIDERYAEIIAGSDQISNSDNARRGSLDRGP